MEYHLDHDQNSKDPKGLEKTHGQSSDRTIRSSKLGDRFKLDKLKPPSAEFRANVVKDVNNVLGKTQGFGHKQQAGKEANEVVRYMSNLPSYLERGENHQEKAFNVGVLEWGRLEKWQNNQQQLSGECSTYSASSSNTSPFSSTEGSSSHSSRDRTCTPGRLRTFQASAESNRRGSLSKFCPHVTKSSEKDVSTAHDHVAIPSNYVKVQQSILKTHQCFNKYTERGAIDTRLKHPHQKSTSDRRSQEPKNQFVTSDSKGKLKVQDGDLEKTEKLHGPNCSFTDQHCRGKQQTVVLHQPKDRRESRNPAAEQSNSTEKYVMDYIEANRQIPFDQPDSNGCELSSDRAHSFRFPCQPDGVGRLQVEQPSSTRTKEIIFPFEMKRAIVHRRGSSISPIRGRNLEDKSIKALSDPAEAAKNKMGHEGALLHPRSNSVSPVRCRTPEDKPKKVLNRPAEVPKLRKGHEAEARNPSPFRRFSFSLGRMVKSSSSDELSSMAQSNHCAGTLGSFGTENNIPPTSTSCEKSNPSRKATVSPLKRLLDPFLKPRGGNSDQSNCSAHGLTVPVDGKCNISNTQGEARALNSVKVKLDLGNCNETDFHHPHDMDNKHGSTTVQALLQIALKNGLPLFTFAVDNSTDILAATMTRLSSGKKDGSTWIFTFFTIHEMKKKSGSWLNCTNKDRKQGYIPNVVGQMKVSDVPTPDLIGKHSAGTFRIREFVLLGVNMRQSDAKTSELQANDELAAIILKLPKMEGDQRKHSEQNMSTVDSRDSSQKINGIEGGGSSVVIEKLLGLTAILPSGQHGLPCKGRPSSLIERWKFGGSCDCGGWDLGCRTRVLTCEAHISKQSSSDSSLSDKKINLYSQEHTLDRKPMVSLSPFKDGIYSVEFDSSLKLLQAFSICIAILNGVKPVEFQEMSNFFPKKSSEDLDGARDSD